MLLTGEAASAEDLVHDTFVRFYARSGPDVDDATAYSVRVLTNLFLDGQRRSVVLDRIRPLLQPRAAARSFEDHVDDGEVLARALVLLPPRERTAVVLRYLHDLPYPDVAAWMAAPEPTVRSWVRRGLRRLRVTITDEERPT